MSSRFHPEFVMISVIAGAAGGKLSQRHTKHITIRAKTITVTNFVNKKKLDRTNLTVLLVTLPKYGETSNILRL